MSATENAMGAENKIERRGNQRRDRRQDKKVRDFTISHRSNGISLRSNAIYIQQRGEKESENPLGPNDMGDS